MKNEELFVMELESASLELIPTRCEGGGCFAGTFKSVGA